MSRKDLRTVPVRCEQPHGITGAPSEAANFVVRSSPTNTSGRIRRKSRSREYVTAGSAIVRDYHGKEYPVHAGCAIYAPAGIAGSHEWEVGKDGLQLLSIRATTDGHRRMQYTVDRETKRSFIELDELAVMDGISYKSHY